MESGDDIAGAYLAVRRSTQSLGATGAKECLHQLDIEPFSLNFAAKKDKNLRFSPFYNEVPVFLPLVPSPPTRVQIWKPI